MKQKKPRQSCYYYNNQLIFVKFQIKIPTSKVSKASVFKSEEKPPEVKSDEKFSEMKSVEKFPGIESDEKFPGIKSGEKSLGIKSEEKSFSLKSEEKFPRIKCEESKPGIDGQEPWSCPQELSSTKKLSKEDMNRNEKYLGSVRYNLCCDFSLVPGGGRRYLEHP